MFNAAVRRKSAARIVACLVAPLLLVGCSVNAVGPLAFLPSLLLPPGSLEAIEFIHSGDSGVLATRMDTSANLANGAFYIALGLDAPPDFERFEVDVLELNPVTLESRTRAAGVSTATPVVKSDGRWIVWPDWMTGGIVARDIAGGDERRFLESAGNVLTLFDVADGTAVVQQGDRSYTGGPLGFSASGPTFLYLVDLQTGDVTRIDLPNEGIAVGAVLAAERLGVVMHVPGAEDDLVPVFIGPSFEGMPPPTYVRAYYGNVSYYDLKDRTWTTIAEKTSVDFVRVMMTETHLAWSETSFTDTSFRPRIRAHRLSDGQTMTLLESNRDDGSFETMYLRDANGTGVLVQREVTPPFTGGPPYLLFPPPEALVRTFEYDFVGFDGAATTLAAFPETPALPALYINAAALTEDFAFLRDPTRGDFHAINLSTLEDRLFSMSRMP